MAVNTGNRRDLVTFQQPTSTVNASNEVVAGWADFCRGWCEIKAIGGSEHSLGAAGQNIAETLHRITTRATAVTSRIDATMRASWTDAFGNARVLYVSAILTASDPADVQFLAQER